MLDRIRSFLLGSSPDPTRDAPEPAPDQLRLAACALLLEVAYADDVFTDEERTHLTGLVRRHFGLDPERADELIQLAELERARSVDLWAFASLINEHYSVGQKVVLAEAMWGLVLADGNLADREDYLLRRISNLLRLKPGYLSQARRRAENAGDDSDLPPRPPD